MPRVSKRKKKEDTRAEIKYYRTCIYVRLSEKDGGHGRRDSIYIQRQICEEFAKKHPELLINQVYADNGFTGTTFERPEFEQLMGEVRAGKVDCIIVKDFSRFGRDALDAVDLIDVIFPSLDVRFISVQDDYDSENPACTQDRVSNILKHFMNDYYAREVSGKLVQAHKMSRDKGEFWGARPPYGYKRSKESSKILVPEEDEKNIIQKIFYWYVFDDMSSYEIAKELNAQNIPSPAESMEIRQEGKRRRDKRILWGAQYIRRIVQNPVYIGAAVYGKTRRMLCQNIPLHLIPKEDWDIRENVREALIEETIFYKAVQKAKEQWAYSLKIWGANTEVEPARNGPFLGIIFCAHCGRRLSRRRTGDGEKYKYFVYLCPTRSIADSVCPLHAIQEKYIADAVKCALEYQIQMASEYKKLYGMEFYKKMEDETKQKVKASKDKYEKYAVKLEQLFEHYAMGILNKEEYLEFKKRYLEEQEDAYTAYLAAEKHSQNLLSRLQANIDWAEELIRCKNVKKINQDIVKRFIEKITVESKDTISIEFWFGDIFNQMAAEVEGGVLNAV